MDIIDLSETMFPDLKGDMLLKFGDWRMALIEQVMDAYGGYTYKRFALSVFKLDANKRETPHSKSTIPFNDKKVFAKVLRLIQLFDMIQEIEKDITPIEGEYKERLAWAMRIGVSIQSLKAMYNLTLRELNAKHCEYFEEV